MKTTVFITNIPAPYREQVHEIASKNLDHDYHVIYCASTESKRQWSFPLGHYRRTFLSQRKIALKGNDFYLLSNVTSVLRNIDPGCIIIAGFSAPMLQAALWGFWRGVPVVGFTDSNVQCERHRPFYKKIIRRLLVPRFSATIGVGKGSSDLFLSYGSKSPYFYSYLCADNDLHATYLSSDRPFDLITCGRISLEKEYPFLLDVLRMLVKTRSINLLVVGDGPYRDEFLDSLGRIPGLTFKYAGFVAPKYLYKSYSCALLMLFPTASDKWGVVANEAMASGTPVICSPEAGVANELIIHGKNGLILEKVVSLWASSIEGLLNNPRLISDLSSSALKDVQKFSYPNAALGISDCAREVSL